MNFDLSDEQRQLSDSLARLLSDTYSFEQRRAIAASPAGWSPKVWQSLVELGLSALMLPETYGGLGGKPSDCLPVMQAFGRALLLEPYLASVVLCGTALNASGDESVKAELLAPLAAGQLRMAWAHDEPAARHSPLWVETLARPSGDSWLLTGCKNPVLQLGGAEKLIVSARRTGAPDQVQGLSLFVLDAQAPGVSCRSYRLIDDSNAGELHLDGAAARALGDPLDSAAAERVIRAAHAAGIAAVCADMVGCMEAAYKLATDYLKTRKQFGKPIGENQALRHRAADMLVSLELGRSMAMAAAAAANEPDETDAQADLMRAKMLIGRHARTMCQSAIQMHGGIGMTEEYAVGHYLRRVTVLDQLFGDSVAQVARLAALA